MLHNTASFIKSGNVKTAMSDDHPSGSDTPNQKRVSFSAAPATVPRRAQSREDLVEVIRDSEQNALIDPDTRDMLEGVMDISDQRVRDIMIPRSQIVTLKRNQTLDECRMSLLILPTPAFR